VFLLNTVQQITVFQLKSDELMLLAMTGDVFYVMTIKREMNIIIFWYVNTFQPW